MARRGELKKQVEYCLKTKPATRNSDIELTIAIWKEYYGQRIVLSKSGVELIRLKDLFDLPREDNVKRIRAKFNELGEYLPTSPEVLKQRGLEEKEWREAMRHFPVTKEQEQEMCPHGLPTYVSCPSCKK